MTDTIYRIVRRENGSFAVEVVRFGALPEMAAGFATEAEVNGWIAQDKRIWESTDPFRSPVNRTRRRI